MDTERARSELLTERGRLQEAAQAEETSERGTEQHGLPGQHAPDQGIDTADWLDDRAARADAERRVREIDTALERIDDGTWGTCEVCGQAIGDERLEARPQAVRCREHAER